MRLTVAATKEFASQTPKSSSASAIRGSALRTGFVSQVRLLLQVIVYLFYIRHCLN